MSTTQTTSEPRTMIKVEHLSKKFGDVTVLHDVNLEVKEKKSL